MVDLTDIRANKWWLSGLFIFIVVSFQPSHSDSACQQTGRVSSWTIGNGSMALYDSDEAKWAFKLNLPTNWKDDKLDLFRFFCINLFLTDSEGWKFYGNETKRHMLTPYFSKSSYNDQVNVSGTFDHAYSGSYELAITSCSSDKYKTVEYQHCGGDCSSIPFKRVPLCPVKTDRSSKFDASKMNFSIMMDINEKGIKVDFNEDYKMSDPLFIPFKEFIVELLWKKQNDDYAPTLSYKIRTKLKHVEFRNCSNSGNCSNDCYEQGSVTICETNLRSGWYSTAVNALDARCNIRGVNKISNMKLTELPTTLQVFNKLKDCERIYASNGKPSFKEFPLPHVPKVAVIDKETYGSPWIITILIGIIMFTALSIFILVMKRRRARAHQMPIATYNNKNKILLNPIGLSNGIKRSQRLLLIYERENENLREKVSILRHSLLKAEGVTQVCDYGDEEQEEEINISGIQNWFLERIHDPSVKIIVILSAELRAQQHKNSNPDLLNHHQKLLAYLMDQLMAVSVATVNHSRIFVLTFDESELPPDDGFWLNPFVRYQMPQHFNQLKEDILLRPTAV